MAVTLGAMKPKRSAKPSDDRRYFKEVRFSQSRAMNSTS